MRFLLFLSFLSPLLGHGQTKMTNAQTINLEWWNMCEYDYDFQKCLSRGQVHTTMLVKLESGGTGKFHMLGDDGTKTSFDVTEAWTYSNRTLFAVTNQMGTKFTLSFFFEGGYYTQCSLRANVLQQGLVFY